MNIPVRTEVDVSIDTINRLIREEAPFDQFTLFVQIGRNLDFADVLAKMDILPVLRAQANLELQAIMNKIQDVTDRKRVGDWVVHPKLGRRGMVNHVYEDNINERGRLLQIDYGVLRCNHREKDITFSSDQTSKWADKETET